MLLPLQRTAKVAPIKSQNGPKSVILEVPLNLFRLLTCASSLYLSLLLLSTLLQLQSAATQAANPQPTYIFANNKRSSQPDQYQQHRSHHNAIFVDTTPTQKKRQSSSINSDAGASAKNEQSVPAEWPFIKSLQSARQSNFNFVDRYSKQRQEAKRGPKALETPVERDELPRAAEQQMAATASSEQLSTVAPAPSIITTTTTTTPATVTTTTVGTGGFVEDNSMSGRQQPPVSPEAEMSLSPSSNDEGAQQLQTTTTMRPIESTTMASDTMMSNARPPDPLFSPDFHSSIQQAVDRIIKMTAEAAKSSTTTTEAPPLPQRGNLKASLSLNVLLKNFGVHNLTNLDQILLKSTLRNDTAAQVSSGRMSSDSKPIKNSPLPSNQPQTGTPQASSEPTLVTINGSHEISNSDSDENETDQSAECKIEYTMKHVNISLMNDSKRDYTCDYIIDRKMSSQNSPSGAQRVNSANVCKLQIRSSFFSNQPEESRVSKETNDADDAITCNGTYLSVGRMRFCYLREFERSQIRALDRVFDFPAELDMFDIKMVHKQQRHSTATEVQPITGEGDSSMADSTSEIHLEIKPMADENCRTKAGFDMDAASLSAMKPSSGVEYDLSSTSTTTSTTTPASVAMRETGQVKPQVSAMADDESDLKRREEPTGSTASPVTGRRETATFVVSSPARRKFVVKIPHDKLPHPLNRIRTSQSFDVSSTPRLHYTSTGLASTSAQSASAPATTKKELVNSSAPVPAKVGTSCDSFEHVATVGQLTSPDYPHYYPANINCSLIIRQASSNFCKVLLHFRDFDLINEPHTLSNGLKQSNEECLDDYLLIGETRYCNRYAMIGHKMTLDFATTQHSQSSQVKPSIELTFRSDHMRSGRGFLLKYQQLDCGSALSDVQRPLHAALPNPKSTATTLIGDLLTQSRQHTVAPPMQQPDFGLALRTTPAATPPSSAARNAKKIRNSAQTSGNSAASNQSTVATSLSSNNTSSSSQPLMSMASTVSAFAATSQAAASDCNQNSSQVCYLELTFIRFDLEADADCRYDYLEINNVRLCGSLKDSMTSNVAQSLQQHQQQHYTTRIYQFNEPLKVIKFQSDELANKSGFLIKVDQLECAANGAILRQGRAMSSAGAPPPSLVPDIRRSSASTSSSSVSSSSSSSSNTSSTFAYDSVLAGALPEQRQVSSQQVRPISSNRMNDAKPVACDDIYQGREATIKSPLWPESYSDNEAIGMCRYTIIRHTSGRNRICQLELRFVNLRLGVSDCIDVDGYEVLCGFNTRNMVKYYPFEQQSHITVTFFTGAGRVSNRRSVVESPLMDSLPTRLPLRFMIIAKQHECVDGFLAPQYDLNGHYHYNNTNLLYTNSPRYVNKTTYNHLLGTNAGTSSGESASSGAALNSFSTTASLSQSAKSNQAGSSIASNDSSLLKYDFASVDAPASSSQLQNPKQKHSTLLYSLTNNSSSAPAQANHTTINLNNKTFDVGCPEGSIVRTGEQLFSSNYPLAYRDNLHCILHLARKSDKFCHLELELLEVDLESRSRLCEADYIQVNFGDRYCNMDQVEQRLGAKRLLLIPFERFNNHKVTLLFHSDSRASAHRGFLIRHRQLECTRALLPVASSAPTNSGVGELDSNGFSTGKTQRVDEVNDLKLIDRVPLSATNTPTRNLIQQQQQQPTVDERCIVQYAQYNGILSSSSLLTRLRSSSISQVRGECELRLKLLPGFCQLQLTFNEFELSPRYKEFCIDSLQLSGIEYCGSELKNQTRILPMTEVSQRLVSIRYSTSQLQQLVAGSSAYGFRAVFKQLECNPEPLRPLNQPGESAIALRSPPRTPTRAQQESTEVSPNEQQSPLSGAAQSGELNQQVVFKETVLRSEFFELNSFKVSKSSETYDPNMFLIYRIKKINPDVCRLRLMFYRFDLEPSPGCKRDFLDINNVDRLCGKLGKPEETRRDYDWPGERDFLVSFVSDASIQHQGFLLFGQQLNQANCSTSNSDKQVSSAVTMATQPMRTNPQPQPAPTTFDEETTTTTTSTTTPAPIKRREEIPVMKGVPALTSDGETNTSGCHKLFYENKFELSSPNWPHRYTGKASCHYLIHRAAPDVCSVTFNVLSMILDVEESAAEVGNIGANSTCDVKRQDHLDLDGQLLCGFISKPRSLTAHFGQRQFLTAKFEAPATSGFGFFIEVRQNKCVDSTTSDSSTGSAGSSRVPSLSVVSSAADAADELTGKEVGNEQQSGCNRLLTEEVSLVESDLFPRHYRHNQDCVFALRRTNQSICAIDVVLNHFELEERNNSTGICENDYLEIDYTRLCGSFPANHRLRFNYFQEELDKLIRFHSDASLSRTGFSLTIHQVSNDCALVSNPAAQQHQHHSTSATTNNNNNRLQNSEPDELISYLPDSSTSRPNSTAVEPPVAVVPVLSQQMSNSSSSSGVGEMDSMREVSTLCQFVYQRERQYLMSPNYNEHRRSYANNMDCLYKIVAKSYDYCSLKLVLLDVDLESSSECHNDYLLIDNQRYCGLNASNSPAKQTGTSTSTAQLSNNKPVIEVQFADTLPREIHLLYHTNANINEGRGFRIFYEQQACSQQDQQSFRLQNGDLRLSSASGTSSEQRQARRLHFGQLSYPSNYVSEQQTDRRAQSEQQQHYRRPDLSRQQTEPQRQRTDSWLEARPSQLLQSPLQLNSFNRAVTNDTRDLDEQHDDLTLRKEIVVVKSAAILSAP